MILIMFDINLFVDKFINNKLNEVEDSFINDNEIYQIINKIKEIKKIDNDEIVQQLILDTSLCLSKASILIMSYYFYDQEILYQGLKNIYVNFIIKTKNKDLFLSYWYHITYFTVCYIKSDKLLFETNYKKSYEYEQERKWWPDIFKKYYCKKFNFCIFSFSIKRWNKIFLYLSYSLYKMNYHFYKCMPYIEILTFIYSIYIKDHFSNKEQKKIINALVKSMIHIMKNKHFFNEKNNNYIKYFDTIISQWNLIYSRYQQIIKNNINKWLNTLERKKFNHLEDKNLLINIVAKLEID